MPLLQEKSKQVKLIGKNKHPEIIKFLTNQKSITKKRKAIIFLFSKILNLKKICL